MVEFMSRRGSLKVASHIFSLPQAAASILYINSAGIWNCCFHAYHFIFIPTYIKLCQLEIVFLTFIFCCFPRQTSCSFYERRRRGGRTRKVEMVKLKALTSRSLPIPSILPPLCRRKEWKIQQREKSNSGGGDVTRRLTKKKNANALQPWPQFERVTGNSEGRGRGGRVTVERRAWAL